MATLKDVAELACVDVSTVSRALNNTSYVHPDTRERIYAAAKELGYHPNMMARALRQGRRHTIGVVVPRLHLTIFSQILQGIEQGASKLGYATLICNTEDDPKTERDCLTKLRNGFVDGIIVAGTGRNGRLIRDIKASGIAVVQIVRQQEASISSVLADYEAGGFDAVNFLYNRGCRKIGLINGSMQITPYRDRYEGYRKALAELGLSETSAVSPQPASVHSLEYGYDCTLELLGTNPKLDAIMAAADVQGIGALRALKEQGRRLEQIRVISLTGHIIGGMLETAMTSMEMPAHEIGVKAALMTIEEIDSPEEHKSGPRHLVYQSSLVEREST